MTPEEKKNLKTTGKIFLWSLIGVVLYLLLVVDDDFFGYVLLLLLPVWGPVVFLLEKLGVSVDPVARLLEVAFAHRVVAVVWILRGLAVFLIVGILRKKPAP